MSNFLSPEVWLAAGICLVLGVFIGAVLTYFVQRRSAGGVSAAQLKSEFDDYQCEVKDHFEKTAELFQDMTEKYRDVYDHLAGGAQNLCGRNGEAPQIELAQRDLLTAAPKPAKEATAEQPADAPKSEPESEAKPKPASAAV